MEQFDIHTFIQEYHERIYGYNIEEDSLGIFPKNRIKEACQKRLKEMFKKEK